MADPTSLSQFGSVFPKKAWITLCKANPDPIWMVWSGFRQMYLVWKQVGVQKSLGPVCCFWQNATGLLPVSQFQTRLHSSTDGPDHTVQNQLRSNWVLVDYIKFWSNGSSLQASRCARIIQPASGQCFRADLDWMQIGSGMFTGSVSTSVVKA